MVGGVIHAVLNAPLRVALIVTLAASATVVLPALAGPELVAHVPVSGSAAPPFGWVEFCTREPHDCPNTRTAPHDITLTPEAWATLVQVNNSVNETIKPLTDLEHWGVVDRWSYPDDGFGDCEDYVLLKRRILIQAGWPRESLLVTVVRDKKDEGHAVLTVTTDKGDYVLDNQQDEILLWWETGHRFIKRQSQSNPNVWVSLLDPRPAISTAAPR